MKRFGELQRFYEILDILDASIGKHYLAQCDNHMQWPWQGVYFFFEPGEFRDNAQQLRVVRVGISNRIQNKQSGLWDRLRQTRGTISGQHAGGGDHRISDFRNYVGSALLRRKGEDCPTWGEIGNKKAAIRHAEYSLEAEVSEVISAMPFLWLSTDSAKNPVIAAQAMRNNAIALLSNYQQTPRDKASPNWLGNYCGNRLVRLSGLWHSDHVSDHYDSLFLNILYKLVRKM